MVADGSKLSVICIAVHSSVSFPVIHASADRERRHWDQGKQLQTEDQVVMLRFISA